MGLLCLLWLTVLLITQYSKAHIMWICTFSLTLHLLILQTCFINTSFLYLVFCCEIGMHKREEENYFWLFATTCHFSQQIATRDLWRADMPLCHKSCGNSMKMSQPGRDLGRPQGRVGAEFRPCARPRAVNQYHSYMGAKLDTVFQMQFRGEWYLQWSATFRSSERTYRVFLTRATQLSICFFAC